MKNMNKIILGLVLVFIGIVVLLNSFGLAQINLFFDGWWTLFIIVPSIIGLINEEDKVGNIIGLSIGVLLLMVCRDILTWGLVLKLVLPLLLIIAGLGLVFNETLKKNISKKVSEKNDNLENIVATFGSEKLKIEKKFDGCIIDSIFGNVEIDLKDASLDNETIIKANAIFGRIDISLPKDVKVEIKSTPIFGGVNNSYRNNKESKKVIYIESLALFGGVDIR